MSKRILAFGLFLIVFSFGVGCRTKGFEYPVAGKELYLSPMAQLDRTLYIKSFTDDRPSRRNSLKRSNLAMIPLVPFAFGSIEHPEYKWRQAFNASATNQDFDDEEEYYYKRSNYKPARLVLSEAALYSFSHSQLFNQVKMAVDEVPANSLVLECKVKSTKFKISKITYCVSFLSIIPWYLIALPKGSSSNHLCIEMALYNGDKEVWQHQFYKVSGRVFGGYYNKGKLFAGYPTNMQAGMNEALADLAFEIQQNPEKFK